MKRVSAAIIGMVIVLAVLTNSHAAGPYNVVKLNAGYLPLGINNTGTIVGGSGSISSPNGFMLSGSNYSPVNYPNASSTVAYHINDSGTIVGWYTDDNGIHGFELNGSSYAYVNIGAMGTGATGINNAGTIIVGSYSDSNKIGHGFSLIGSNPPIPIDYPNAATTCVLGINNAGTIVGWWSETPTNCFSGNGVGAFSGHGFTLLRDGTTYESFDFPNSSATRAMGINNYGTIVGSYSDSGGNIRGFSRSNAKIFAPIPELTYAYGINDSGTIVGSLISGNVLYGYKASIVNVANINNVSDTFTVWMDMTSVKDGTPAPTLCGDIFKIIDGSGKSAIKQSCAFLDNGTGRHKITFQITGDTTQPNKRARYIEQGSFYFCTSAGISATDLSNCALISGTPSDFSVYGTTFDIGKHAWKFANGSWMNTSGQPSKFYAANSSSWWVFKNNFYKAASVIQSYIRYADIADFWNSIGYGAYNVRTGSKLYQHKSDGLCYGLANSAIAGYSHQDSSTTWGIRDFTQANWSADILSRWDDSTKTTSPFSPLFAPDENIYTAPSLNDLSTIWTINSAKKIMYYFVTHPAWSGQNWVGKDSTQNLNASSESTFIKILKGGAPVSLYIREVQGSEPKGYHEVAVPQLLIWNGHRYLMIWDNNYPLGRLSNAFGPYTSLYFDSTNSYDPTKMTRYEIISTETSDAYLYNNLFLANYAFLSPGCSDSQNIYNQWTAPCTTFQASSEQANAPDVSDYPYPNHIQVLIIGAQLNSVYDQTTSSSPTLVPGGDVITGQAVQTVSGDGLFTTLYLPATDTYQIQATKYAGFTGLTVLVTIPNTDGTAQLLNYNNMSTGDANTTHITFTVGRGNTNTGVVRTIANDTYNPDYNGTLPTALNPPTGLKAVVNNSGTGVALSWTNTSNLLLASVLVIRKAGSVPTSTTDGVTVYSGTGQGVTDNTVTANTVYYYAAYSFDHSSNPSDPAVIQVDTTLRSIYGTISVSGGGLAGAVLQLLDSNSKLVSSTSSAADGTYAISNIANGSYTLTASSSTAAITNPSVPVAISGTSHEVDFSATNQKTLFLLYDAPSVAVGDTVSISWAYRNISNSETVNITLLRSGVWETIASGVPILNGTVSWTVTSPNVTSATLKISLASDSTVNAQFTFAIAPGYDFLGVPVSGAAPLAVNFADQSLGSMAWLWNFGDGATSTVQNPLHMYSSSGTYNVSLTATGSSGQTTITKNSYVSVSGTCNALPVTIADTNDYYSSIENALNYAGNGATLQLQAVPLTDSPNIARNISFKLSGGYGCDYSMNPGYTIVSGVMTISQGTVIMENIIVK